MQARAQAQDYQLAGLVTAKEAAALAGVQPAAVYMAISRHRLSWAATGRKVGLLERGAVEEWVQARRKRRRVLPSIEEYVGRMRESQATANA